MVQEKIFDVVEVFGYLKSELFYLQKIIKVFKENARKIC